MSEPRTCACDGTTLPLLVRPWVLAMLARGSAHGYEISQHLAEQRMFAGREPDPAGVYRALREMESLGLVLADWSVGDGGPARRVFTLTADGRECLVRWRSSLSDYREAVGDLLAVIDGGVT